MRNSFKTPLVVEVMPSGKKFRLHFAFTYVWRKMKGWHIKITVPADFETDFASIPRPFRILIPKLGRYNKAAVIHDAIYQNAISTFLTRKDADVCFRDGMAGLGVVKWKRTLMYWGVRIGGWMAWRKR